MVKAALVLRVWWETRPWVQEAHSGTEEMPRVTASEVNSGLWPHRHKLWRLITVSSPLLP